MWRQGQINLTKGQTRIGSRFSRRCFCPGCHDAVARLCYLVGLRRASEGAVPLREGCGKVPCHPCTVAAIRSVPGATSAPAKGSQCSLRQSCSELPLGWSHVGKVSLLTPQEPQDCHNIRMGAPLRICILAGSVHYYLLWSAADSSQVYHYLDFQRKASRFGC